MSELYGPSHTHCITCSDEGVAMRVVQARPDGVAVCVDPDLPPDAAPSEVMVDLVGDVEPGDMVLVHAGVALARLAPCPQPERNPAS